MILMYSCQFLMLSNRLDDDARGDVLLFLYCLFLLLINSMVHHIWKFLKTFTNLQFQFSGLILVYVLC